MPGMVDRYVFGVLQLVKPWIVVILRLSEDQIVLLLWSDIESSGAM
jgi:hypothetical protein